MLEEKARLSDKDLAEIAGNRIKALEQALLALAHVLPDSKHEKPCWNWCWNELDDDAQEAVKAARRQASAAMMGDD